MAQENTSRLIVDAISQALAKPHDSTPIGVTSPWKPRTFDQIKHPTLQMMQTLPHLGKQIICA